MSHVWKKRQTSVKPLVFIGSKLERAMCTQHNTTPHNTAKSRAEQSRSHQSLEEEDRKKKKKKEKVWRKAEKEPAREGGGTKERKEGRKEDKPREIAGIAP